MKTSDLSFKLPPEKIALRPLSERTSSRLLVVARDGAVEHALFRDIINYLDEGDLLILNDSKVLPVRLRVRKPSGSIIDLVMVKPISPLQWEIICRGRYTGKVIIDDGIEAEIVMSGQDRTKSIIFSGSIGSIIERYGLMPLPPYIKRLPDESDRTAYQTVYASRDGSIAAPTAGLHFTEELLSHIKAKGVDIETLSLHVGRGTFLPVKSDDLSNHKMESEHFEVRRELINNIEACRARSKKVIAVGTTTARTIEGIFSGRFSTSESTNGKLCGSTDIFIYPGYKFKALTSLATNFHLPNSTPLMLVSAILGIEKTKEIYNIAIARDYRFFSYGDAMLIL